MCNLLPNIVPSINAGNKNTLKMITELLIKPEYKYKKRTHKANTTQKATKVALKTCFFLI